MTEKYLVETKKALEIVERKVREFEHGPDRKGRMVLLEKLMPKAKDFDEHQVLKNEYDLLAFQEIKGMEETPIPEEVKRRILANYDIEMGALKADAEAKYLELEKHLVAFEEVAMPLLKELDAMHQTANSVARLGALVDITYRSSITGNMVRSPFNMPFNTSFTKNYSHSMKIQLEKLLNLRGGVK